MLIPLETLDDERLLPFRELKKTNDTRWRQWFIAEGEKVVERLLGSQFPVHSLLLGERLVPRWESRLPADVPCYVLPDHVLDVIVGFNFHQGILACGVRTPAPDWETALGPPQDRTRALTVVICPDVQNPENLGAILRISAAFGVDAVLLGPRAGDPFTRRVLRVSMGEIFRVPVLNSNDMLRDLHRLRAEWGVELAATVLADGAEPLRDAARSRRFGLLFGGEGHGLTPECVAACGRRLTIPMRLGTDSLNVAVSAGIFLHHFADPPR